MKITPALEVYRTSNKAVAAVFAKRLRFLRDLFDVSLEELADKLKISRQSLVYYAMGDRLPRIPILISIAKIFGTSTDYLLGLSDEYKLLHKNK